MASDSYVETPSEVSELLKRIACGESSAMDELIRDYESFVVRSIRRYLSRVLRSKYDTDDFAQAVWMTIIEHRERLNGITDLPQLIGFLTVVASRKVMYEHRRHFARKKRDLSKEQRLEQEGHSADLPARVPTASEFVIAEELWSQLTEGISDRDCQIVELRASGEAIETIAQQLSINERTVRRALERIRGRLDLKAL